MKYTIMRYNKRYLEIVEKNVEKEQLDEYGIVEDIIYADYEATQECGFVLLKGKDKLYAILQK